MNILQINSVYGFGSTGRIVKDLHNYFIDEGFDSSVIYGRGEVSDEVDVHLISNSFEMYTHILRTRIMNRHGFGSKFNTKQVIRKIEEINPDVILLHNLHGYYLNIKLLFEYISTKKIKVIWLLHDAWTITGHSAYINFKDEEEMELDYSMDKHFVYPKTYFFYPNKWNLREKEAIFTSLDPENLTIVTPSKWLSKIISLSFMSKYKIKTIYNGINTRTFRIIDGIEKRENKKIILGVANYWTNEKGLQIFNELAEKLSSEYQIILVGVDKKTVGKINKKIEIVSRTNSTEELVEYYNLAEAFVNPTYFDNFPTTNIEALCCGTPVITFDTGGSPESIDSTSGIITGEKTSKAIIESLGHLRESNITSVSCRKRGEMFSIPNMRTEYMKLIKRMVGEKVVNTEKFNI